MTMIMCTMVCAAREGQQMQKERCREPTRQRPDTNNSDAAEMGMPCGATQYYASFHFSAVMPMCTSLFFFLLFLLSILSGLLIA